MAIISNSNMSKMKGIFNLSSYIQIIVVELYLD